MCSNGYANGCFEIWHLGHSLRFVPCREPNAQPREGHSGTKHSLDSSGEPFGHGQKLTPPTTTWADFLDRASRGKEDGKFVSLRQFPALDGHDVPVQLCESGSAVLPG